MGIKVILASGRPTPGVLPLAKELELDKYGNFILSFNGAKIINCKTMETVYEKTLPNNVIPDIYQRAVNHKVVIAAHDVDRMYIGNGVNHYATYESEIIHLPYKVVDDFPAHVTFPTYKLLLSEEPENLDVIENELKNYYHNYLSIYRSEPFFLEVMPANINKANSLTKLMAGLGLSTDELICCGDGFNDISMIKCAGLGVAMENAQPIVKEAADFITLSNDDDGILHVINKFILNC